MSTNSIQTGCINEACYWNLVSLTHFCLWCVSVNMNLQTVLKTLWEYDLSFFSLKSIILGMIIKTPIYLINSSSIVILESSAGELEFWATIVWCHDRRITTLLKPLAGEGDSIRGKFNSKPGKVWDPPPNCF